MRFTPHRAQFIFCRMVFTSKNLDWWCERAILWLVLGLIAFAAAAFGAVDEWAMLVVEGGAAAIFILWAVRLWLSRRPKILWPPLAWAVLAFMALAVARYFTADIEYVARQEVIQALLFGLLFFAVLNNLRSQDETEFATLALLVVATLIAGYAAAQLAHHSNHVWNQLSPYPGRASGTFISPNNLAGFLELLLPLAVAFLLVGKVNIITRILLGYATLALGVGLAATFSRAGWVAAAVGLVLLLGILLSHRNHWLKAVILLFALLAGGGFFASKYLAQTPGYMRRVAGPDAQGPGALDLDSRLQMWRAAAQMWRDHFWFGVGPGHYDYRFREYRPETLQLRPDRAHNDYLNLLADWGTAGGVVVFAGVAVFIWGLFKTWPHVRRQENDFGSGQSNRFAFFLGAVGGLGALAVHSLMDFNWHIPANALVAVTLLALVASNLRFAAEQYWVRSLGPLRVTATICLGGIALVLAADISRRAPETFWLARAAATDNFSDARMAALKKAFAAEPKNFQTTYELGECYRTQSLDGGANYAALAQAARTWYATGMRLNPHDGYNFLRSGMCLDWLGRHAEAEPLFREAERRDPNGHYLIANIGCHYVETGDYAAARQWFKRAIRLGNYSEPIAENYLAICEARLLEQASEKRLLPSGF